jgi:hypothetical protein
MVGFIPEITTKVTVTSDTTQIDDAISLMESDPILSELSSIIDELQDKKNTIKSLEEPVGDAVSQSLKSNQEMIISSKHYITGMMANSVDITQDGSDFLVGNTATSYDGFPYPLAIETGRREVFPINAKMLRWFDGGTPIFATHSSSVDPDPFVEPSIDDTMYDIDKIVNDAINEVL